MCSTTPPAAGSSWNGWGVSPTNARFQGETVARLAVADVARLKVKWAFGFAGDASAAVQPSIAGRRVFVANASGQVLALDLQEGCLYWTYDADAKVRTAVALGPIGGTQAAFFGDVGGTVYSVDATTGAAAMEDGRSTSIRWPE